MTQGPAGSFQRGAYRMYRERDRIPSWQLLPGVEPGVGLPRRNRRACRISQTECLEDRARQRDDPRAKISIDAAEFPVAILFGGDYVALADGLDGRFPRLSNRLLDSMQKGQSMILHFDLVTKRPDEQRSSDNKAIVDLRADGGREAIAAMRLCAGPLSSTGPLEDHAGYWLDVTRGG
jgi:hypothetical protein